MPFLKESTYKQPPFYQFNGHLQSIIPAFRKVKNITFRRERITTPDNDFLDLDWIDNNADKLVLLTHGFEGNSTRPYMVGMAKMFSKNNWDVLSWNCRSCSGEINRTLKMYNHGNIEDIDYVIHHALQQKAYKEIVLIGFSMGGNITLKYAALKANPLVTKVIAYSAPLDMKSSIWILAEKHNWLYRLNFEKKLQPKLVQKHQQYPEYLTQEDISHKDWEKQLHTFFCKVNGYESLETFYKLGSAVNFIPHLKIPALIVQSLNDPLLTPECFPTDLADNHDFIHLETPQYGGHCGFSLASDKTFNWAEHRAWEFVNQN